ncbi:hypothetical protein M422DRAFT_45240 [Sphaerobolus stellatus SS14]|nr:hypothetical protein M422DRAFT_45240 [Sphaerobolus stellatus SS14]
MNAAPAGGVSDQSMDIDIPPQKLDIPSSPRAGTILTLPGAPKEGTSQPVIRVGGQREESGAIRHSDGELEAVFVVHSTQKRRTQAETDDNDIMVDDKRVKKKTKTPNPISKQELVNAAPPKAPGKRGRKAKTAVTASGPHIEKPVEGGGRVTR